MKMADKKELSFDEFIQKVSAESPEFARALQDEDDYLQFCKKVREDLKHLRESKAIKQSELADLLQMSQPAVSKMESGEGDIGVLTLCRYAGALGMQPTIAFTTAAPEYQEQDSLISKVNEASEMAKRLTGRSNVAAG